MKAGTQNHLKMKRLMRILSIPLYRAVGILECLWLMCVDCCDEGNVGKFSDDEIADYLGWDGDPQTLIQGLVTSGWFDPHERERLVVHDWLDHAPEFIKERLRKRAMRGDKRREIRTYVQSEPDNGGTSADKTGQGWDQPPLVPSIPIPSQPIPSTSNPTNSLFCDETDQPSSSPAVTSEPPVLEFPCDGKPATWGLVESQLAQWRALYPSLDVDAECRSALAWVLADATRRKTARGMQRFIVGWLGRSQNRGTNVRPSSHRSGGAAPGDAINRFR